MSKQKEEVERGELLFGDDLPALLIGLCINAVGLCLSISVHMLYMLYMTAKTYLTCPT